MVVFDLYHSLRLLWKGYSVLLPVVKVGRIGLAILFRLALVLGHILSSDQVRTVDSFPASLFSASAN